ncbi:dual specificity protein phosphatase 16 isoform 2-T2 [Menidia menidia]
MSERSGSRSGPGSGRPRSVRAMGGGALVALLEGGAERVVLIDSRPFVDYNAAHILEAVNVNCSKLMKRRLQQDKVQIAELLQHSARKKLELQGDQEVVVYDQSSSDPDALGADCFLSVLLGKLERSFPSVHLLSGGFSEFSQVFPGLCEGGPPLDPPQDPQTGLAPPSLGPTCILPHLYLGCQRDVLDQALMQRLGVAFVLNASPSLPQPADFVPDSCFLRVPVHDSFCERILPWLDRALTFIGRAEASGGRVLVHCLAGVSRSATIAIAYVMRREGLPLEEAYRFVKDRRPSISPNFNFLGQLLDFEKKLKPSDSVPPPLEPHANAKVHAAIAKGATATNTNEGNTNAIKGTNVNGANANSTNSANGAMAAIATANGTNGPNGSNAANANSPNANGPNANGANGPNVNPNGPNANANGLNGPNINANGPNANGPNGSNDPNANGPNGFNNPNANGPNANGPNSSNNPNANGPNSSNDPNANGPNGLNSSNNPNANGPNGSNNANGPNGSNDPNANTNGATTVRLPLDPPLALPCVLAGAVSLGVGEQLSEALNGLQLAAGGLPDDGARPKRSFSLDIKSYGGGGDTGATSVACQFSPVQEVSEQSSPEQSPDTEEVAPAGPAPPAVARATGALKGWHSDVLLAPGGWLLGGGGGVGLAAFGYGAVGLEAVRRRRRRGAGYHGDSRRSWHEESSFEKQLKRRGCQVAFGEELAPPTNWLAPPTSRLAPPTSRLAPPTSRSSFSGSMEVIQVS